MSTNVIQTRRLKLRHWETADRPVFAVMHRDREVMHDAGGPLSDSVSDLKFESYASAFARLGFSRWALEDAAGDFLGYAGIMPGRPDHPLGFHHEIGWGLVRSAWGHGYATEAAGAALLDFFERTEINEVLAYTAADNSRSQAVMERLGLRRDGSRDYVSDHPLRPGFRLVWVADRGWTGGL